LVKKQRVEDPHAVLFIRQHPLQGVGCAHDRAHGNLGGTARVIFLDSGGRPIDFLLVELAPGYY
jgi:hypothetical protein